jgi:hypothetical protein
MKNVMKVVWVLVFLCMVGSVQAAVVTWSSELLASDGSNVLAGGTEHVGVSYGSNAGDSRMINGVNFKINDEVGNHDNPNWAGWIDNRNGSATRYGAAGTDLKELTNDIVYGGTLVLGINNLTIGNIYRIQLISYDASNWWNTEGGEDQIERAMTITATGGTSFDFQHGTESPYASIDDVGAALVIGTWTADATEIDFTVGIRGNNDNAIINGFVVQDLTPKAVNVGPIDGAIGVSVTTALQWKAPRTQDPGNPGLPDMDTTSFIVYCDPNEVRLRAATFDNHAGVTYFSDQLVNGDIGDDLIQSYDPDPDMDINTIYYWRVDTRFGTDPNIFKGIVWEFNTDAQPTIDVQPDDKLLYYNEDAVFEVVASDPTGGGLSYQWYHNGTDPENEVANATSSILTISNPLDELDMGFYICKITNSGGDTWTRSALLIIKDLIGHWEMEDNAVDSAGGYDGSLVGEPNWVSGVVGSRAIELYDSEGVIVVLDEYYPVGGKQLTVSAWVYAETKVGWGSILKNWGDGIGGMIHLGLDSAAWALDVQITQADGTSITISEPAEFPEKEWQYVAAIADGSKIRLYRNGAEVISADYDGTLRVEIPYISIGYKTGDDGLPSTQAPGYWNGKIDDVKIYNYALTKEEIAQSYFDVSGIGVCIDSPAYDIAGDDCVVNLLDLAEFASDWLSCGLFPESECQ